MVEDLSKREDTFAAFSPKKPELKEKPIVSKPKIAQPVIEPTKPQLPEYINYFEGTKVKVMDLIAASFQSMPTEAEISLPVKQKVHPFPRVPLLNTQQHFSSFNLNVLFFIVYRLQKVQPQQWIWAF